MGGGSLVSWGSFRGLDMTKEGWGGGNDSGQGYGLRMGTMVKGLINL